MSSAPYRFAVRPSPLRIALVLVLAPAFVALFGCPPPAPTCDATPPELLDINFHRVRAAIEASDDVTQLNMGLKTEAQLRERWERTGITLEFHQVLGNPYTYMFITDDISREHAIVLSGTTRPNEWRLDFQVELVYDTDLGVNLHSGWRTAARAVASDVLPRLKEGYTLYIYGYSLGAGTAAILCVYMENVLGVDVVEVIASGMPRVTDAAGAALFNAAPLLRIAAANDTIPFFPPDPYTTVGDALVLLDGPFVCRQKPGDSDYDNHPTTPDPIAGLNPEDHITYVPRISDKTDVPVCLIPYADRQGYINSD